MFHHLKTFFKFEIKACKELFSHLERRRLFGGFKVVRYSFLERIPPTFERKLCRHKQRFGQINTTVVLDKDETLL